MAVCICKVDCGDTINDGKTSEVFKISEVRNNRRKWNIGDPEQSGKQTCADIHPKFLKNIFMNTSDIMGGIGVTITLVAYFCMSFKYMPAHGRLFFLLNTLGAALTCFSSWLITYWPFLYWKEHGQLHQ